MKQRGRPSKAAATLSAVPSPTPIATRPEPPAELPARAGELWREFTASKPPAYFDRSSRPLLRMLVLALAECERLEAAAAELDVVADLDALAKITRLIDLHRARASQAMTRLRLTKQAVADPKTAGRQAGDHRSAAERMRAAYMQGDD